MVSNVNRVSKMSLADKLRWSGTAVDICFINKLHELFFKSGKGVPLWRRVRDPKTQQDILPGLGVDQPSMDFCVDLLNAGRWVHFFPQVRVYIVRSLISQSFVGLVTTPKWSNCALLKCCGYLRRDFSNSYFTVIVIQNRLTCYGPFQLHLSQNRSTHVVNTLTSIFAFIFYFTDFIHFPSILGSHHSSLRTRLRRRHQNKMGYWSTSC